jgi:Tfp pilus assembly protein FimT
VSAFTLIELAGVMTLGSLILGGAIYSLRGPLRAARMGQSVDELAQIDQLARSHASRHGRPGDLIFDLSQGTVAAKFRGEQNDAALTASADKVAAIFVHGRRRETGVARIPISARGGTPSYAVQMQTKDEAEQWILFAGASGQITHFSRGSDAEALLRITKPRGADAR